VLLRRWETFAAFAAFDEQLVGPDALRPAPEVVAERLERAFRRVRKSGKAAMRSNDRNDWHSLRKDLKRFRYLLAAFSGVFPKGAVDRVIVDLAELQEHLGRLQDRRVQAAIVSDAGLVVGGRSALAAGAIAEMLRRSEDKAHRRCYRAYRRFEHSDVRAELAKLSA
jgi:CHAD domain-containing protein